MTFCCCPTQLSVSADVSLCSEWAEPPIEWIVHACNTIWRWGEGGGTSGWLLLNAHGWWIPFIYLFSYVYYIQSGPFIYPMYLSTFLLKSAVWQDLLHVCAHSFH
jgi:hypothetical protein